MRRLWLALTILLGLTVGAAAQGCGPSNPNCIVPTAPPGTSNNQAASTAFVQGAISGGGGTPQNANTFFGGPLSGPAAAPAFRAITSADLAIPLATVNAWSAQQTFAANGTANFGSAVNVTGRAFVGNGQTNFWPFSPTAYISSNPFLYLQDPYGTNALAAYMRSSDWSSTYPPNGGGNVGQTFTELNFTLHDRTSSGPFGVWGKYSQYVRTATADTSILSFQHEYSLLDLTSASSSQDPFNWNVANATHILRVDCGVGTSNPLGMGTNCTSGYELLNNGAQFLVGLTFGYNSIATVSSHINAISMPVGYEVGWFNCSGGCTPSSAGTSTGTAPARTASIFGDSTGITLSGLGNAVKLVANSVTQFDCNSTFTNFCTVNASAGLASGAITNLGASGYLFVNGTPSGTAPNIVPNRSDTKAGIGADTAGDVSIIVDNAGTATEVLRAIGTGGIIRLPTVTTGTPVASLCIDTNNNIIKKTTAGSCI